MDDYIYLVNIVPESIIGYKPEKIMIGFIFKTPEEAVWLLGWFVQIIKMGRIFRKYSGKSLISDSEHTFGCRR